MQLKPIDTVSKILSTKLRAFTLSFNFLLTYWLDTKIKTSIYNEKCLKHNSFHQIMFEKPLIYSPQNQGTPHLVLLENKHYFCDAHRFWMDPSTGYQTLCAFLCPHFSRPISTLDHPTRNPLAWNGFQRLSSYFPGGVVIDCRLVPSSAMCEPTNLIFSLR